MIWKKKIREPKKQDLNDLEIEILNHLMQKLPKKESKLVSQQLKYLVLNKRIEYSKDYSIELYPEKFNGIPKNLLFERTEEFRLALIYFEINNDKYVCEINAVLGTIFDLIFKPKPRKSLKSPPKFVHIVLEENMLVNEYEVKS